MKTWSDSQLGNNSETLLPTLFSISQGCHRDNIPPELLSLWTCFLFLYFWDGNSCLSDSWGSSDTVPTWGDKIQLSGMLPDSKLWALWTLMVLYMLHNLPYDSLYSITIPWKSLDEKTIWIRRNNQNISNSSDSKNSNRWLPSSKSKRMRQGNAAWRRNWHCDGGGQRGHIWSVTIHPEAVVAVDPDFMYGTVWKCWAIMDPDSSNTGSFRLFSS